MFRREDRQNPTNKTLKNELSINVNIFAFIYIQDILKLKKEQPFFVEIYCQILPDFL